MALKKLPRAPAPVGLARRAKIVCTLGPATDKPEILAALIDAGMNVARLNFSHGSYEEHARRLRLLRRLARERGKGLPVVQDLQGPKIRTGKLEGGKHVELRTDAEVTITTRAVPGNARQLSTTFSALPNEVRPGSRILLADGLVELRVKRVAGQDIACRVINGGTLGEHQGINLPGIPLKISALTAKDRADLEFGIAHGVDYIALSFVRRACDVQDLKQFLERAGKPIPVIAKLEKPEAINHLDEIMKAADAVMVARGDLGVELAPEEVPVIQKTVIERANFFKIPVITATQMLESMRLNPRPTRAEASDVANAVFDGTDAVMLSGETASGHYPVESVRMMSRIISAAEQSPRYGMTSRERRAPRGTLGVAESICESVAHMAEALSLKAIAVFTQSGSSARLISKYRPRVPVFAFSPLPAINRRSELFWGVTPVLMGRV
ncbi:MAG: pyruvate kinase, partial [Deltaproteobacteria bacterium]